MSTTPLTIGVLALQGDFDAHRRALERLGVRTVLVRKPEELDGIDGLVIPGGESSTFLKFLEREGFLEKLRDFVSTKPAFGTCAGAILLAKEVLNPSQPSLGALDIAIRRNAYGRQIDSSIMMSATSLGTEPLEMVFIRAPRIERTGKSVEVLAEREDHPVLVRDGKILAATFHPELSSDLRVHQLFLDMVKQARNGNASGGNRLE
ncbi:MAG: pyridoxal 5'-phosphate synthase glutaminase subunit PdxT [Acidobacteria bacterium]|nr:pyridoxal 5'-phosphate synthase glutaminase subunit PdxT [Acidobacteriota bacterium]MBV9437968.1 pyridoxal 5'-phosphate synthase glutaminase subunit PdxT [Acidobacteriota bacterium]